MKNPKILHRVYFDDMPPFKDPFQHYLATWSRELPDYKIMQWNASTINFQENDWVKRAFEAKAPVFLSEYLRWKALSQYGGIYLDADCEILNGAKLHEIAEETFRSQEYSAALGVEDYTNGYPTAQTVIARPDSELVRFMLAMYERYLSGPLWHWREIRGLIGPQLISLYFLENGFRENNGMMCRLDNPEIRCGVKVYPQEYFSPKFEIDGTSLRHTENTCVYHLFANLNMHWDDATKVRMRESPLLFSEYVELLKSGRGRGTEGSVSGSSSSNSHVLTNSRPKAVDSLKTLHRIYFGFDGLPDSCSGYLETWKQQLPGYEIKHWNAENLPMNINEYVRELARAKDHAFLSDYFRWWILREYGGIYLDADVEVVDGAEFNILVEDLEDHPEFEAFIGIDEKGGGWYTAHSMASKKQSDIARFMCKIYENLGPLRGWQKKSFILWAPQLTALYFHDRGHNVGGMGATPQLEMPAVQCGVKIYPQDYFSPLTPLAGNDGGLFTLNGYTERTALCHHFACSWHDATSAYASHAASMSGGSNTLLADLLKGKAARAAKRSAGISGSEAGRIGPFGLKGRISRLTKGWVAPPKSAREEVREANTDEPMRKERSAEGLVSAGDEARDRRAWKDAELAYFKSLQINPKLDAIWVQLGHAQKEQGRLADAERSYRQAVSLNETSSDSFLQLGHVLKLMGRFSESWAAYRNALKLDPNNKDVQQEFGD